MTDPGHERLDETLVAPGALRLVQMTATISSLALRVAFVDLGDETRAVGSDHHEPRSILGEYDDAVGLRLGQGTH